MKTNLKYITLAALAIGAVYSANAQDKATLDLLVSKGVITQGEADKISKDSVKISPKEKTTKSIKLSGNLQFQYENIGVKEFDSDSSNHLTSQNNFIARRLFLGVEADLGAGWSANIVTDFANTKTYINNAFISKKVDWNFLQGKLDIGYAKVNFGFEENTSAAKLLTIERSLTTTYFTDGSNGRKLGFGARHTGVFWNGKVDQVEGLTYGFAIANSYNNSPTTLATGGDNTLSYWANIAYARKVADVDLKAGLNFGYTNGTNVSTDAAPVHSSIYGFNPYITAKFYGFYLWSDFFYSGVDNGRLNYTGTANPLGLNVGVEYRFDIGDLGQLGPTVRYSWLDTDGRGIKTSDGIRNASANSTYDAAQSVYIGANWYLSGDAIKFQLGYEWAQFNGAQSGKTAATIADANAVRAQVQVLF